MLPDVVRPQKEPPAMPAPGPFPRYRCTRCGACCRWAGYVRLKNAAEADRIAEFLELSPREFIERYAQLPADRRSLVLTERHDAACIFLDGRNRCRIYPVRPEQCRRFPDRWNFPGFRAVCRCTDTWETDGPGSPDDRTPPPGLRPPICPADSAEG